MVERTVDTRRARSSSTPREAALVDSWQAPGSGQWLGRVLPTMIGAVGLLMLGTAVYVPVRDGGTAGISSAALLGLLACLAGWLVWKVVGTVWRVGRALDNTLVCCAARRRWRLGPNEILAVKGDAYGLFLVLVTIRGKIWLWAQMDDRRGLLTAIRRSNPHVEVDSYAEPRRL